MAETDYQALKSDLLDAALGEAVFEGWTARTLTEAALAVPDAEPLLPLLFPKGVADLLEFWAMREDQAMRDEWDGLEARPQKIRDKVTWLVRRRIEGITSHKEAARRAAGTLALPHHGALGARLTWGTADAIWRALGDKSLDYNYYTKRATLSAVYTSTLVRWFADESEDAAETWAFLDDRIENVMQFEKFKAQVNLPIDGAKVADWLGGLRYPAPDKG